MADARARRVTRPPPEVVAWRRLAPQRGLIAAGSAGDRSVVAFGFRAHWANCTIPEPSNFGSLPGRAGGLPTRITSPTHSGPCCFSGMGEYGVRSILLASASSEDPTDGGEMQAQMGGDGLLGVAVRLDRGRAAGIPRVPVAPLARAQEPVQGRARRTARAFRNLRAAGLPRTWALRRSAQGASPSMLCARRSRHNDPACRPARTHWR